MPGEIEAKHEKASELAIAKRVVWVIPILLALIGYFSNRSLSNIETAQRDQGAKLETLSADVRVLNTRMEYSLIEQLKDVRQRVDKRILHSRIEHPHIGAERFLLCALIPLRCFDIAQRSIAEISDQAEQ